MMKPLYKQPLIEAAILASGIMCTVLLIHGVQNFIAMGGKPATSQIAEKSNPDLVPVAAGGGCPYSANVSLGQTAGGSEMRDRPDKNMKVYSPFPPLYINKSSGTKPPGTALVGDGKPDPKLPIIGTIFGYKPSSVNYYAMLETDGKPVPAGWIQYLIGVPTDIGAEIKAPQTGYDIGGGKMGLVVYATNDQITIHIGRHEYLSSTNSSESGGYWIYLKGLCVNSEIVSKYNANAGSRAQLPELSKGELLGYATGSEVLLAVRDNGPFTDILAPEWWTGVPAKTVAPPVDGGGNPDPGGGGTKLDLNVQCTDDAKCLSGNCSLQSSPPIKLCKQGTSVPGADCTDKSQCASDKCESGKCVAQAPGTHTVSGTITVTGAGNDGNLVFAQLYKVSDNALVQATTPSASRAYSISGVEKGQYKIKGFLVKPGHIIGQAVIAQSDYAIVTVGEGNVPNQDLTIDAPAATTSTVSGTITLAGGIGSNKVRVQIFNDAATPVLKYQNDPSTNLTYSIPGVINGTYQIHADLINSADTITSSSPDRAFVVRGSDIKDLDLSIPAPAAAPPATGLPDWVTNRLFCIDTSKSCKSVGKINDNLYCGDNTHDRKILPYVQLRPSPGYQEDCNYGGVPYLDGKRSITITKGATSVYGVDYCVYTAINLQGKTAVCEGSSYSCRDICDFKNNPDPTTPVTFNIHVRNATGVPDNQFIVESVAFKKDGQPYTTTKSSNLEYSVDIPFNKVIINSMYSSNEVTIKFHTTAISGDSRTYTKMGYLSLPVDKAEFVILLNYL